MIDLPFTYSWLIKRSVNKAIKTILELGCGRGYFGDLVNENLRYQITGVEIFQPYVAECKEKGKYSKVIKGDISRKLPFKNKSFDAAVCLQTIEHLERQAGLTLIDEMERIAKNLVVISTPNGSCLQEEYDDNEHQRHLSAWRPSDFVKRGYRVFGIGLKWVYGEHSCVNAQVELIKFPLYFLSFLMNPMSNKFPKLACQIVAVKRK